MIRGIISYGAYVPAMRVQLGSAKTKRIACSYDEDTTTMAVEAARVALAAIPDGDMPRSLAFVTTTPAYVDKTNANAIHAALLLPPEALAADLGGAARSAVAALRASFSGNDSQLVVASDMRVGLPGSTDESGGVDAAAALVIGEAKGKDGIIAEHLASGTATLEFLDRWRLPHEPHARAWEERFGYETYLELLHPAFERALDAAGLAPQAVNDLIVTGANARAVSGARRQLAGVTSNEALRRPSVGDVGAASGFFELTRAFDDGHSGDLIVWVSLTDGVDVDIFRLQKGVESRDKQTGHTHPIMDVDYLDYLTWRGELGRERPRRPDPPRPAAPPSRRSESWKFGLVGSSCDRCGRRYAPPQRMCTCGALDEMSDLPIRDVHGTIATYTLDHLAHTPQPPIVAAAVNLDGGGRMQCQLTDVEPSDVAVGDRVEMTFRKLFTSDGVHNYFWKARPVALQAPDPRGEK